ncbi:unnamed protein product [Acanthocheilonema viteae]|uniref:Secreted protein n=1 Tax=Acanthocheilonema viteae TaxID=6277 RepID=A0A498SGQ1_ACAVI|nr:unnamed protein product [Acanthocheilonema viteae]
MTMIIRTMLAAAAAAAAATAAAMIDETVRGTTISPANDIESEGDCLQDVQRKKRKKGVGTEYKVLKKTVREVEGVGGALKGMASNKRTPPVDTVNSSSSGSGIGSGCSCTTTVALSQCLHHRRHRGTNEPCLALQTSRPSSFRSSHDLLLRTRIGIRIVSLRTATLSTSYVCDCIC